MTDRYTELVKQAYEAQQAREGETYLSKQARVAAIEAEVETAYAVREQSIQDALAKFGEAHDRLKTEREQVVVELEAMDDAVEAAKEALDAYFAGREEDAHPLTRDHMYEHDEDELGPKASYDLGDDTEVVEWDETASARGGGGLNDIPN